MCKELQIHYLSLKAWAYDEQDAQIPITRKDFGSKYAMEAGKFTRSWPYPDSAAAMVNGAKRCHSFLIEAISQVENRLPPARYIFSSLFVLSRQPSYHSWDLSTMTCQCIIYWRITSGLKRNTESYHTLSGWKNLSSIGGEVPTDPLNFWSGVSKCETSLGEHPFQELADYALTCQTAPVSNAICERIFSSVTCVKTKYRNTNRMG